VSNEDFELRPVRLPLTPADREMGVNERWNLERAPRRYDRAELDAAVAAERSRWLVRLAELDAKLSRHFAPEAELARFLLEEAVTDVVGRDLETPPR
jgi:hypothetical protein